MPWSLYGGGAGAGASETRALDQRFQLLERRLTALEQKATLPANYTRDFVAHEWETVFVQAPSTGLAGLLPTPKPTNRGAVIRLICQNTNLVTLRAVGATVNGQPQLLRAQVGAFSLVCDGATGWWMEPLGLPRPRDCFLQDYFCSGGTTSGTIGALGWGLFGAGTPAVTRNSAGLNSANKLTLTTTAAANDRTTVCLSNSESGDVVDPQEFSVLQAIWNFNAVLTDKRVYFGLAASLTPAPGASTDAIGLLYDSSVGGNYLLLARAGSAGSAVDSGVAVPSNTPELLTIWQSTPGVYRFYVGNRLLGTITGNTLIPNVPLNCGFRLETLTTAAKTQRVGYFGLRAMNLVSPFNDDEFLRG